MKAELILKVQICSTRTLNNYATKNNLIKNDKITLTGDDFREGLTCVISIKVPEPQFEGQTKPNSCNSEGKPELYRQSPVKVLEIILMKSIHCQENN